MQTSNYYQDLYNILMSKKANPSITWKDVQDLKSQYGVNESKDTIRKGSKELYDFLDAGWVLIPPNGSVVPTKETIVINADNTQVSEKSFNIDDESKLRDYDYLLKLHNYDPKLFEITSAKNSKWHSGNNILYSSKITVKPKSAVEQLSADKINEMLNNIQPRTDYPTKTYMRANNLLMVSISDLHLNLYASEMLTGNTYDCGQATDCFWMVIDDIIEQIRKTPIEKIIFTIGGDMFNSDNQAGTTTKGTPQDNELHLFEAFEIGLSLIIKAIDLLVDFAPVDVIYIAGNHDETVGWQFAKVIEAYYRNVKLVNVDTSPKARKYYVYGNTLLVFSHNADVKRLPMIIADEVREWWSKVKFVDVFLQHLHSEQVLLEEHHIRIQRLPTISGVSKWSYDNGYVNHRQHKTFIYDKETGLRTVIYTSIK